MKKQKSGLKHRLEKSFADKDKGAFGAPAFNWKALDDEIKFFKVKEGKNRINIIPYRIKSKNHPLVRSKDAAIGDLDYLIDLFIHKSIGPSSASVICPKKNFGKPCPICEKGDEFRAAGKDKEQGELRAQRMVYYNVIDVRDEEQIIQVFGISHFLFEHELIDEARGATDDGEIVDFPDIEDGKVIVFRATPATFGGHDYFKFKGFQFIDREDALDEDLIDKAISFDAIMNLPTYEEIEAILYGKDDEEDDEPDDEPKTKSKKPVVEEEEEESDNDPPPKTKVKKHKEDEEEEDEPDDKPEDDDPSPVRTPKGSKSKKPVTEEEELVEDPAPGKCPYKHEFGKDVDKCDECEDCPKWAPCLKENTRMKKKAKEAK